MKSPLFWSIFLIKVEAFNSRFSFLLCCIHPASARISLRHNRRPYFCKLFRGVHMSSAALLQGCYYFYLALQPPTVHRKDFNHSFCFHFFPSLQLPLTSPPLRAVGCFFLQKRQRLKGHNRASHVGLLNLNISFKWIKHKC